MTRTVEKEELISFVNGEVAKVRRVLLQSLAESKARGAAEFVEFARGGHSDVLPCWGNLQQRFDESFPADVDRIAFWKTLRDNPDRRALLLFIDANRTRDAVLAQVILDAGRLPDEVQVALVTTTELQPLVAAHLSAFGPTARLLWQQGPAAIRKEGRIVQTRIARLKALWGARPGEPPVTDPPTPDDPACDADDSHDTKGR